MNTIKITVEIEGKEFFGMCRDYGEDFGKTLKGMQDKINELHNQYLYSMKAGRYANS